MLSAKEKHLVPCMLARNPKGGEQIMANLANKCKVESIIDEIGITSDRLTSRGGLSLFSRYLRNTGVVSHLESLFGSVRKNSKGRPVGDIFKSRQAGFFP